MVLQVRILQLTTHDAPDAPHSAMMVASLIGFCHVWACLAASSGALVQYKVGCPCRQGWCFNS